MASLRDIVRKRAGDRCEYCRMPQEYFRMLFCLDRVVAGQHGGEYEEQNIAYACHFCNRKKGPNLSGIDSETGEITRLFNPRVDSWEDHFRFHGFAVLGLTAVGRATVVVLGMNEPKQRHLRKLFGVNE